MGNQGNSGEGIRQVCEWVWDGAIGEIQEAHAWTNRPIWALEPGAPGWKCMWRSWYVEMGSFRISTAEERPYNPIYTPWNWRGWRDFPRNRRSGRYGLPHHGPELFFMSLKLKYPTKVQGSSSLFNTESPPLAQTVTYTFPKREKFQKLKMPEVK